MGPSKVKQRKMVPVRTTTTLQTGFALKDGSCSGGAADLAELVLRILLRSVLSEPDRTGPVG